MGCSASAFATKEECDAGGAFCTFDDPFCTTNIGLIIGIVAGVFVFIVLVSIAVRCYFAQQPGGAPITGLFMGAPMNDNTNNTNNNFNVSSAPNSTGGGWNSGNTMNNNNNNNNTGGWNAGPSSPGGYGQQPAYPPPPPPPPGQYNNTFNQSPGGATAGQPAPDNLPAPSFAGYGSQPPNQAY